MGKKKKKKEWRDTIKYTKYVTTNQYLTSKDDIVRLGEAQKWSFSFNSIQNPLLLLFPLSLWQVPPNPFHFSLSSVHPLILSSSCLLDRAKLSAKARESQAKEGIRIGKFNGHIGLDLDLDEKWRINLPITVYCSMLQDSGWLRTFRLGRSILRSVFGILLAGRSTLTWKHPAGFFEYGYRYGFGGPEESMEE